MSAWFLDSELSTCLKLKIFTIIISMLYYLFIVYANVSWQRDRGDFRKSSAHSERNLCIQNSLYSSNLCSVGWYISILSVVRYWVITSTIRVRSFILSTKFSELCKSEIVNFPQLQCLIEAVLWLCENLMDLIHNDIKT